METEESREERNFKKKIRKFEKIRKKDKIIR